MTLNMDTEDIREMLPYIHVECQEKYVLVATPAVGEL
jgi:hypothetical protein